MDITEVILGFGDIAMRVAGPLFMTLISLISYNGIFKILPILVDSETVLGKLAYGFGFWCIFNVLFNYVSCLTTHPGTVPPEFNNEDISPTLKQAGEEKRFCKKCNVAKPPRSHHCSICKACVLVMDHHCPWVNNCVGYYNYKYFYLFLFHLFVACVYVTLMTLRAFISLSAKMPEHPTNYDYKLRAGRSSITFAFVLTTAISVAVGGLLAFHTYLILSAQTTIESYGNGVKARNHRLRGEVWRNPYSLGYRRNFEQVFGPNCLPFRWMLPSLADAPGDGVHFKVVGDLSL